MSTIATLSILVKGHTGHFEKGMRRGRRSAKGFRSTVKSLKTAVLGLGAAYVSMAGARALGAYVKREMDAIDATAKFSDTIGLGTESLLRWRHAAELSGVAQTDFDKSMVRFVKTLGDAKRGIGIIVQTYEQLGMGAKQLKEMDTQAAFRATADAVAAIEDPALRASIAQEIFGRSGIKMVKVLEDGSAGLEELGSSLRYTYSRLDARDIERANDAFTRLSATVRGLGQELVVSAAPGLEALADSLEKIAGARSTKAGIHWLADVPAGLDALMDYNDMILAGQRATWSFFRGKGFRDPRAAGRDLPSTPFKPPLTSPAAAVKETVDFVKQAKARSAAVVETAAAMLDLQDATRRQGGLGQVAEMVNDLSLQARALREGISPEGITLIELESLGLATSELQRLRGLMAEVKGLEAARAAAAERREIAERSAIELATRGEAMRKQFRTPLEQLRARAAEIERLFAAGAISSETGARAYADAVKQAQAGMGRASDRMEGSFALVTSRLTRGAVAGAAQKDSVPEKVQNVVDSLATTNRLLGRILDDGGLA